jgi:aryl-alcohol dehydrogenase
MQIKAAVVRERSGPFAIETVELCEPRPDEVIVCVVASGMCQTDLHGRDGYFDSPYPAVYGHEGAGVVHAVGSAVHGLAPGDHVVMSYPWCGGCANCQQQQQNYCVHGRNLKSGGTRADGSTLLAKNGAPVYSAFFQQSSFGTFSLSQERYIVKVRNDAPLELLGPLACSGQTGGGVRYALETSAVPAVFREAIECLMPAGTCVLLGSARKGSDVSFEMPFLQQGRTVRGVVQGDSVPQQFIPKLVDLIMAKQFPIERMIKLYDFADINLAARESSAGIAIKPVLRMPE